MGNSDTDSESECFESAEESLDESEEVKSVGSESKKSEKEVVEPVYENVDSTPQVEKDVSSNSMSYRKRPDRVKRSVSNTTPKPTPKMPSDAVFKADKIVPDAFFQDITSNLSKNINKSLSTLQQKSSNVKDLILSTLPVTSIDDGEGFSYDAIDHTDMCEGEVLELEAEPQTKNCSDLLIGNVIKEKTVKRDESHEEEKLIKETNSLVVDKFSSNSEERKPPDIINSTQENNSVGDFNLNSSTLVDNIEERIGNFTPKENQDALDSCKNKANKDRNKGKAEYSLEKRKELIDNDFSNSSCTEDLCNQEANICDVKNTASVNLSHQTKELSESTITTPAEYTETENTSEKNYDSNKPLESAQPNQLPFHQGELIGLESNIKLTEDSGSLIKNSLPEEKAELNSKCNLEELKTALENIVQDKTSSNITGEVSESEHTKEDFTLKEEKVEVNQGVNDGWDDFDFSDDEVENIITNESDIKDKDLKQVVPGSTGVLAAVTETVSGDNKRGAKPFTDVINQPSSKTDLVMQQNSDSKFKNNSEQVAEPEPVSNDGWDWDDNWDDTPEDKKENVGVNEKLKSNKPVEDSSDLSKWSGWDTFAQKPQEKQGNWGLGSWGMDVLINKATAVTQGISNVLEAGLGAPDPETLARMEKLEREKLKEFEPEESQEYLEEMSKRNSLTNVNLFPVSGITSLVAGVTSKIVEHSKIQEIGSKVITGGLDTLETFGKKTMEVLQEGDPGLKNKRALLMGNNKPVLSQVLKEAREKADREIKKAEEKEMAKKCHFETLFDDFQGMVHLEALEMLSKQCELKLEQIRSGMNSEEQEDLNGILEEVEQLCALDECEFDLKSSVLDFKTALNMAVEPLKNEISVHRIIQIHENVTKWLEMSSQTEYSLILINQKLVSTLAELAAATVQQFHKSGELLSIKECRKTVEEVDALSRLTNLLCTEINKLCEKFIVLSGNKTSTAGANDSLSSLKERVTVVMNNSTSYIRQAFDLLIPVMQLGAAV